MGKRRLSGRPLLIRIGTEIIGTHRRTLKFVRRRSKVGAALLFSTPPFLLLALLGLFVFLLPLFGLITVVASFLSKMIVLFEWKRRHFFSLERFSSFNSLFGSRVVFGFWSYFLGAKGFNFIELVVVDRTRVGNQQ